MEHKKRETVFKKGHSGQRAQTVFELPGLQMTVLASALERREGYLPVLDITTHKTERGDLVSSASVHQEKSENGFTSHVHAIFADYCKRAITTPGPVRATAKTIEAQHLRALEMLPQILADVALFYSDKCGKERRDHPAEVAQ